MTAYELYEKSAKIRDKYRDMHRMQVCYNCCEVFTQMLVATFQNEDKKDELPEVFFLHYVSFSSDEIKFLMQSLGLTVNVELTCNNYARGNCFRCTQV